MTIGILHNFDCGSSREMLSVIEASGGNRGG